VWGRIHREFLKTFSNFSVCNNFKIKKPSKKQLKTFFIGIPCAILANSLVSVLYLIWTSVITQTQRTLHWGKVCTQRPVADDALG
jgi:hypothetical protein